jgi:hypothetical protein
MEKPIKQRLVCWCCGDLFMTRKGYKDQDQDIWYWICKSCQAIDKKTNKKRYSDTFNMIYNGLKDENKKKCDQKLLEMWNIYKTILVNIALEKWRIERKIG